MSIFNGKDDKKVGAPESISISNMIGKGTLITGDLETAGNLRIDGKLKGNIHSKAKVALGAGSLVDGNIYSQNADIEGEVTGILEIADTLVLKATAIIKGDIITNKLVVEAGAKFNGTCRMGEQPMPREQSKAEHTKVESKKSATV
ncbi:MAG: polymer-forming cytoskeletal protein [Cytophagales bacterium]|nr:MAG: polymer-forming cytoskeletal protein [Cytophagales bacterium]